MVRRIYVEKKEGLRHEASSLLNELQTVLGVETLKDLRIINRYDVEGLDESDFSRSVKTVFSEPQLDDVCENLEHSYDKAFVSQFLAGQFDQRADSASACIALLTEKERPLVAYAKVYLLFGELSEQDVEKIKKYVINPVESNEVSMDTPETLVMKSETPAKPMILDGFRELKEEDLTDFLKKFSLAMDENDLICCRDYFVTENRDPSITELRILDTYWSDHCRHTTFSTHLNQVEIADEKVLKAYDNYLAIRKETNSTHKPVTLMDMAVHGTKYLKKIGAIPDLDESEEINACTVKIDVDHDGKTEPWLLLFKNETHNHPTEIEPFGGAATCIGGAIRDPLSGRSYVYQAMRVTGAADPRTSLKDTLEGKLPQRKIVQAAADGYSSYGNQIGLATGLVHEIYHKGYAAKRLEIGAVVGAAPQENVRREEPFDGNIVILVGGRTGRDGCGGATGSSKSHDEKSVSTCSAEVQKGNAPEERKLQRLFRNKKAMNMVLRCNDFGAGGVSVAVGELADSLEIDLSAVPKKYEGLDATELAISESQERMAVVVERENVEEFIKIANSENLEATVVARVKDDGRMTMKWNGEVVADLSRAFLNTNGAKKEAKVTILKRDLIKSENVESFKETLENAAKELENCSRFGLASRFDSTIGAGSILMPFGGKHQKTPTQSMVAKIPVETGDTTTCSIMAYGGDPYLTEKDPYMGAYLAVLDSVAKVIASGGTMEKCWLSLQEYFPKLGTNPERWGLPVSALLGALQAQIDLKVAAIGGKDSMSGSFGQIDVPPTLVSFAVSVGNTGKIISNELKSAGHKIALLTPKYDENGIPEKESFNACLAIVEENIQNGKIKAANVVDKAGIAMTLMKAGLGNKLGVAFNSELTTTELFSKVFGGFLLEVEEEIAGTRVIAEVTEKAEISYNNEKVCLCGLEKSWENVLEGIYKTQAPAKETSVERIVSDKVSTIRPRILTAKPKILIPVFYGTNCEYDSAKACEKAGLEAEIFVLNNQSAQDIENSIKSFVSKVEQTNAIFIPGGFSGGDEPEGSAKFITAFFRNPFVKDATMELLKNRDGLMLGICNGFQALIKLGLLPYGEIMDTDENCPTLSYNLIARHQSSIVRTKISTKNSPWLQNASFDETYSVPISHGEGRFICPENVLKELIANGQIATQYVDLCGNASMDIAYNPNGSTCAIEGICSADGRILGKMGHSERVGDGLYQNVCGNYDMGLFKSAKEYFSL